MKIGRMRSGQPGEEDMTGENDMTGGTGMGSRKKRTEMMIKIREVLKTGYPPGYEYRQECRAAVILFGIGIIPGLDFFRKLYRVFGEVVRVENGRIIPTGLEAEPFAWLVQGQEGMFAPFFLFLAAMSVYHYFYYYRGAKSIYLMRRLPERRTMIKSCIWGPALCMAAGAVLMAALRLLYYLIYLLIIPAQCLPG